MSLSNEELIEALSNKPIMEVVELVRALEEKWGVSAAAPVAVAAAAAPGAEAAAAEEKTEFDVVMSSFGDNKVAEGWSLLTYALARYPDKLCGHDVLCNSFRNPAHLAKMVGSWKLKKRS